MDESPQIRAFIDCRTQLAQAPTAEAWRDAVSLYQELAVDLAQRDVSWWVSGWATNTDAFEIEKRQAGREATVLGVALAQLEAWPDLQLLDPDWQVEVLRSMQRVAMVAGAWETGEDVLGAAAVQLPADVVKRAAEIAAAAGQVIINLGEAATKASTWYGLGAAAAGIGLLVVAVSVARARVR